MSDDFENELRPDLLDDFYSECDEHLSAIRQALGALEKESADGKEPSSAHVRSLLNSFHSFKGISALAGVVSAEQLAHAAEDYLRLLSVQKTPVPPESLNALMLATKRLEQTVGAHREKKPLPDVQAELLALVSIAKTDTASEKPPSEPENATLSARIAEARRDGLLVWRCSFTPAKELDARGININSVRERLAKLGRILEAAPKVEAQKISFAFVLALREPPENLAEWEADAIRFEPLPDADSPEKDAPGFAPDDSASAPHNPFVAPSRLVRVDIEKLDELMRVLGDLVIQRARLEEQVAQLASRENDPLAFPFREIGRRLSGSLGELREAIMGVRLVPVAHLFERMPFVVRDLASDSGKKVRVQLSGQETQIDKFIIDQLKAPLLHLVRNAISHGIEEPVIRKKQKKTEEATILLAAKTSGDAVIISVYDDGRGIDSKEVAKRAAAMDIEVPETMTAADLLSTLCRPGFSTRDTPDRAAGRGVGMAMAYEAVRELGGSMTLETEKGKGTSFILRLPLTLAIADVFVVSSANIFYAVPRGTIAEVLLLDEMKIRRVGKTELLHYRNGILPLVRLSEYFQRPTTQKHQHVLVVESERGLVGLVVDRVIGHREVVVKALSEPFAHAEGFSGATELGDGRPVLILDISTVTGRAARPLRSQKQKEAATSA